MNYEGEGVGSGDKLPTIEGWLDKQGGVRKSWKRRYFVLDGKRLKYYKQQRDAPHKPIDAISLERTSKIIFIRDKVRPSDSTAGCGFAIETPNRTYILAANSMSERDRWATDIQLALSVLYGLPKPVTISKDRAPSPPSTGAAEPSPRASMLGGATTNGQSRTPSPRYSMAFSEIPVHQPPIVDNGHATISGAVETAPVIEDYSGMNAGPADLERVSRGGSSQNLLSIAKNGLNALKPTPLGRKDEIDMLKEELVRKEKQLEMTERKLMLLDGAYADLSEKYFVSVAIFAKMNATAQGFYCNIDVYDLYAEAKKQKVDPQDWPHWITVQVQKHTARLRG